VPAQTPDGLDRTMTYVPMSIVVPLLVSTHRGGASDGWRFVRSWVGWRMD